MVQTARPARSRRSDFEDSRRRILAAARLILAERGPEALTVSEVAHRSGLNRTTAYQHFRTRDALAAAVTAELGEELTSQFAESQPIWPFSATIATIEAGVGSEAEERSGGELPSSRCSQC